MMKSSCLYKLPISVLGGYVGWYQQGTPEKIEVDDFGAWKASKRPKGIAISIDEDQIGEGLIKIVRDGIEPGRLVFDAKYFPLP